MRQSLHLMRTRSFESVGLARYWAHSMFQSDPSKLLNYQKGCQKKWVRAVRKRASPYKTPPHWHNSRHSDNQMILPLFMYFPSSILNIQNRQSMEEMQLKAMPDVAPPLQKNNHKFTKNNKRRGWLLYKTHTTHSTHSRKLLEKQKSYIFFYTWT